MLVRMAGSHWVLYMLPRVAIALGLKTISGSKGTKRCSRLEVRGCALPEQRNVMLRCGKQQERLLSEIRSMRQGCRSFLGQWRGRLVANEKAARGWGLPHQRRWSVDDNPEYFKLLHLALSVEEVKDLGCWLSFPAGFLVEAMKISFST